MTDDTIVIHRTVGSHMTDTTVVVQRTVDGHDVSTENGNWRAVCLLLSVTLALGAVSAAISLGVIYSGKPDPSTPKPLNSNKKCMINISEISYLYDCIGIDQCVYVTNVASLANVTCTMNSLYGIHEVKKASNVNWYDFERTTAGLQWVLNHTVIVDMVDASYTTANNYYNSNYFCLSNDNLTKTCIVKNYMADARCINTNNVLMSSTNSYNRSLTDKAFCITNVPYKLTEQLSDDCITISSDLILYSACLRIGDCTLDICNSTVVLGEIMLWN
jgi:hypothetical protein